MPCLSSAFFRLLHSPGPSDLFFFFILTLALWTFILFLLTYMHCPTSKLALFCCLFSVLLPWYLFPNPYASLMHPFLLRALLPGFQWPFTCLLLGLLLIQTI